METTKLEMEYTKPQISDYGDLAELTAGCNGAPADFQGLNNSLASANSRGICISTP